MAGVTGAPGAPAFKEHASMTDTDDAQQHYRLVVLGSTPGGIACAVRAAREGLSVLLVSYERTLGGMLAGGLGVTDTLYDGFRAPLYQAFCDGVVEHYRATYGAGSEQHLASKKGRRYYFEPRVAEKILTDLVAAEPAIEVLRGWYVEGVERRARRLLAVQLAPFAEDGRAAGAAPQERRRASAEIFVDASYEGDLAAAAGAPYHIGRESRAEHDEQHAGRIFTRHGYFPREAHEGRLNLGTFPVVGQEVFAGSTGEGDGLVQTYNYRVCLSRDPENRRYPEKPAAYNREDYAGLLEDQATNLHHPSALRGEFLLQGNQHVRMGEGSVPNRKASWNSNGCVGAQHPYPDGDWPTRRAVERRHKDFALGLLWFLQNDPDVPDTVRADARRWGLAQDEFVQNGNFPTHLYVREARRLRGRYTFTEHDGTLARGLGRAPIHADSIAIAEWAMDSHEVTQERQYASLNDGKFLLSEATRPSQIPYRCLLPQGLDNLLVPVCLSSTHVGWGTLRLEPVWMHVGEVAAYAAALAVRAGALPADLPVDTLQRHLVERQVMITFFNDLDMATPEPWVPAIQYLGARGYFPTYDARPDEQLDAPTAARWSQLSGRDVQPRQTRAQAALALYASLTSPE